MSKKQMGFTLIEIVMVLVLLGILSAVAVPKYFDLRDTAEQKAAQAIVAEAQARINGAFASALLNDGKSCKDAQTAIKDVVSTAENAMADGYTFTYSVTAAGPVATTLKKAASATGGATYTFKSAETGKLRIPALVFPECAGGVNGYTTTSGGS